jgi:hypothetical protein
MPARVTLGDSAAAGETPAIFVSPSKAGMRTSPLSILRRNPVSSATQLQLVWPRASPETAPKPLPQPSERLFLHQTYLQKIPLTPSQIHVIVLRPGRGKVGREYRIGN